MNFFCWQRLVSVVKKEIMHIMRDPFVLLMSVVMPFLIVVILGGSIEFNLDKISLTVVNFDQKEESRSLISAFNSSNYFRVYNTVSPMVAFDEIVKEKAKAALIIPPNFSLNFVKNIEGLDARVQILLDGADNSAISSISNYLGIIQTDSVSKCMGYQLETTSPVQITERFLFNPELNSKWFAIPGLSAVIIALIATLLTTLTICREWEAGSMELLISTPVKSSELMLGKIVPYSVLSSIGFMIVLLVARLVFKVPMKGSYLTLFIATFLFIVNYLGVGLFVSVTTKEQRIAVQKAMTIGLLPNTMLSGFVFPVQFMPTVLQWLTMCFPARWYIDVSRSIFLRGAGISDLWGSLAILSLQGIFMIFLSIINFHRSLE